jgi:hypothetical protein
VIQTAGLVQSWRDISKAYWFLALTVGIVTPLISAPRCRRRSTSAHEGDLLPHWASVVANAPFAMVVGLLGSVILIMAVNTAYVASSELLERVGHRYRFDWLLATNARASLYRIHMLNALMYSGIILLTSGSQAILAEMYAIGLLASFCINVGCLLIYRYFMGTKEIRGGYVTSRVGTLALEAILVACFIYLVAHRPYGTGLWAGVVVVLLATAVPLSRRYGPEVLEVRRSDYPMEMLLALGETDGPIDVYFRRPGELDIVQSSPQAAFVTFFSPRQPIPAKVAPNHYRFRSRAERLPQHQRDPGAARGARGPRRARPLRLADVVLARPPRGRRLRRQPDAAPEVLPEAQLLDRPSGADRPLRRHRHGRARRAVLTVQTRVLPERWRPSARALGPADGVWGHRKRAGREAPEHWTGPQNLTTRSVRRGRSSRAAARSRESGRPGSRPPGAAR